MALINCPECSREISDKADVCPNCGFPIADYVEKIKAEQSKADAIEAEKKRYEKQKELLKQHNTSQEQQNSDSNHDFSNKGIYVTILVIVVFTIIYGIVVQINNNYKDKQEISQKKAWFNSAKILIKDNKVSDDELDRVKASLESVDKDMPEYKEAQELLPIIKKRLEETQKAKEAKEAKEHKAVEESKFTSGGKRVHARHPEWDADDCNTIAKRQIHIGMTSEQVRAAWGRPYHINRTSNTYGESEQWVMHEMGSSYVYFENGICTTIQN